MNCYHPWHSLVRMYNNGYDKGHKNKIGPNYHYMMCTVCGDELTRFGANNGGTAVAQFERDFVEDVYRQQGGVFPAPFMDMYGTPLVVGSKVVYPVMASRACQMSEGVVLVINPPTKGMIRQVKRIGEPERLKIQPTGKTTRWSNTWSDLKPVTLNQNAGSAVVIG